MAKAKYARPVWLDIDPHNCSPTEESPPEDWESYNRGQLEKLVPMFDRVILNWRSEDQIDLYLGRTRRDPDELTLLCYERDMLVHLLESPDATPEDLAAMMRRPSPAAGPHPPLILYATHYEGAKVFAGGGWHPRVDLTEERFKVLKALRDVFPGRLHLDQLAKASGIGAPRHVIYGMRRHPILKQILNVGGVRGTGYGIVSHHVT